MATRFFNTAYSLSMHSTFPVQLDMVELSAEDAAKWLAEGNVNNVANPTHANTLDAVSKKLNVDVKSTAKGGRVILTSGDHMLVAQVTFPPSVPRETKEYTDEQVALGKFTFVLVTVS